MAERKYYVLCESNCKFESMTKEQILTAIQQAVTTGEIKDVDTGFITTIKDQNRGNALTFWVGTTAEYNAIEEKAEDCFYILTDDTKDADTAAAIEELRTEIENIIPLIGKQAPYYVTFSGRVVPSGADKTFDEIYQAIINGENVIGRHKLSTGYEYYQLTRYTENILSFEHTKEYNYDTTNNKMSGQLETRLIRFMNDGTIRHNEIQLPQSVSHYGEYISNIVSINELYSDLYSIDESISKAYIYGNRVFVSVVIDVIDDTAKAITAKGTQSSLREIIVPKLDINEVQAPLFSMGGFQCVVECEDIDSANNYTISKHILPCSIIYESENVYTITPDTNYIISQSATAVNGFKIYCSWLIGE